MNESGDGSHGSTLHAQLQPTIGAAAEDDVSGSSASARERDGGCAAAMARLLLCCGAPPASARQARGSWYDARRVRLCLYGSPCLWAPTWAVSYAVWLAGGCLPFLPFVSDFGAAGAPTHAFFAAAMTVAALLWCATFVDLYHATRPKLLVLLLLPPTAAAGQSVQSAGSGGGGGGGNCGGRFGVGAVLALHGAQPFLGLATALGNRTNTLFWAAAFPCDCTLDPT